MAIIHHQFESIHPFYDGNGRTGRIINILYLVKEGLLTLPILYLSRYINQHKAEYYRLLQQTRQSQDWEPWLLFMLEGVAQTAQQTTQMIVNIKTQMQEVKHTMRSQLPKIYSQDLLNNLFNHPYTKIEFVMNELLLSKPTAIKYLDALIEVGILQKHKIGRETYYINQRLFETIMNVPKL
ncbi:Fic family protein [Runella zeae]|uniref:Fic family protein n=1 Tax=Runella zeae TaxID=94255 RepID=UPI0003F8BFF9|nr:Fic family protein [Runella zeae]